MNAMLHYNIDRDKAKEYYPVMGSSLQDPRLHVEEIQTNDDNIFMISRQTATCTQCEITAARLGGTHFRCNASLENPSL